MDNYALIAHAAIYDAIKRRISAKYKNGVCFLFSSQLSSTASLFPLYTDLNAHLQRRHPPPNWGGREQSISPAQRREENGGGSYSVFVEFSETKLRVDLFIRVVPIPRAVPLVIDFIRIPSSYPTTRVNWIKHALQELRMHSQCLYSSPFSLPAAAATQLSVFVP